MSETGPIGEVLKQTIERPPKWGKHRRWKWAWTKWRAFVEFVERVWPRNL